MKKRIMSLAIMFMLLFALSPASPAQGRHPQIQQAIQRIGECQEAPGGSSARLRGP